MVQEWWRWHAELCVYATLWTYSSLCSLHYLYNVQEEIFYNHNITPAELPDLKQGWSFISRYRDESDIEWMSWKHYYHKACLCLLVHFFGSEILRNVNKKLVPYWYIAFTMNYILIFFGVRQTLLIFCQPVIYAITLKISGKRKRTMVWILSVLLLTAMNSGRYKDFLWNFVDHKQNLRDEDVHLIWIALGWIEVRCMSFSFDYIDKEYNLSEEKKRKYLDVCGSTLITRILSYSLYFPTLFFGPVILYSDFEDSLNIRNEQNLNVRLRRFLPNIAIFMIYSYLMDLALHYIYFLAMQHDVKYVSMLPSLALCGAGLWMGVQFHLKYVIMYGTSGIFASLDHIEPPPTPRCIARIHLYSQMWKYFDVGLYRFLVRYIYKPILAVISKKQTATTSQKILASFLTFTFIYLWHGTIMTIFVWSVLNYIGVLLETIGSAGEKSQLYIKFKNTILRTNHMEARFKALISTPLLLMSALSNFYLFAELKVGNIFVKRLLSESWFNIAFIFFCLHTCCHVSAALSDVPSRTARKTKTT